MKFVSRAEWGARPPTAAIPSIDSTVTTGHWEGGGIWGGVIGSHDSCATKVRAIQAYHMDNNGWSDIAYNTVACPHGYVFEGRGPQKRSAANGTNFANGVSAVCCYLGGQGDPFTDEGMQAMVDAAAYLGDLMRKGHRDWYNTQCPGDIIYAWIQAGTPVPIPPPPSTTLGEKMGQCRDNFITAAYPAGRKWFIIVGDDRQAWARVDGQAGGKYFPLGGIWTSGLDVMCEKSPDPKVNGLIVVFGRGSDGGSYQMLVYTDGGPTPPTPGKTVYIEPLGGHIYPPA